MGSKITDQTFVAEEIRVTYASQLGIIICHSCTGVYALADKFLKRRQADGVGWTCPYCKQGTAYSESHVDKLQRELRKQQESTAYQRDEKERALHQRDSANRSCAAFKGVATKKTKQLDRVKNGVCPCCNRHFKNLQRHMKSKHSEVL